MEELAAAIFRESGAHMEGHFQLASGRHSPAYVEKFRVLEHPRHTETLCQMIAERFRGLRPQVVAGPTTGGIIISYEVARALGLRGIFAERADEGRAFQRGFVIEPGEQVIIVDDVLTTGGSVRDVIDAVRRAGGEPVGVGVLVDRRGQAGSDTAFGLPFFACLNLDFPTYESDACPLCAAGTPLKIT
jgi:orotate phosphoribosyltransferase